MIAAQPSEVLSTTASPTTPVIKMTKSSSSRGSTSTPKQDGGSISVNSVIKWLAPGAAQAVSSIAIGHPFDTVKTRVQTGMHSGVVECLKETFKTEGGLALYRGAPLPLCSLLSKRPIEFYFWERTSVGFDKLWYGAPPPKRADGTKQVTPGTFVSGGCTGIISGLLGCPFTVVKVKVQNSRSTDVGRESITQVIRGIWRSEGIRGFWRGLSASWIWNVPSCTVYLGMYGTLRNQMPGGKFHTAMHGAASSMVMWLVLLPLDTVKTVIQSAWATGQNPGGNPGQMPHWPTVFKHVKATRGIGGLWAGLPAVMLRSVPVSAVSMICYEVAKDWADTL